MFDFTKDKLSEGQANFSIKSSFQANFIPSLGEMQRVMSHVADQLQLEASEVNSLLKLDEYISEDSNLKEVDSIRNDYRSEFKASFIEELKTNV